MFFVYFSHAQTTRSVIAAACGNSVKGDISLGWTLGETIIPTLKNGDLILTHGSQQQWILTTIEEKHELPGIIKIFPNPAGGALNIFFQSPTDGEIKLNMYDSQGKPVINDIVGISMNEKRINLKEIPAGIYYLQLTKGKLLNVYKVVKL